ncbi:MAG: PepSY domain-containing protein [Planctomycetes bacterium]|nr:PepSY domain-containing protein [Planctomycetota bacterium]
MKASILNRKLHRWGAILTAAPLLVIIVTGVLLHLKKESDWVQPPAARSDDPALNLSFDEILKAIRNDEAAKKTGITSWEDIDRLDVRIERGIVKVRGKNRWEVQVDTGTGEVLQVAYRRSDLIESLHDGSWFDEKAKFGLFLPAAVILFGLWCTGIYLWLLPHLARRNRSKQNRRATPSTPDRGSTDPGS